MTLSALSATYLEEHPSAAVRVLEGLPAATVLAMVSELSPGSAALCLQRIEPSVAAECLREMPHGEVANILKELPVSSAGLLALRLPRAARVAILDALPKTYAAALRIGMSYAGSTVGSRVDPNAIVARAEMTIADAVAVGRRDPKALRKYLYLIDEQHHLVGVVDVRQCLVARRRRDPIGTLSEPNVVALRARSSLERGRAHPGWKRFAMLPVVDRENVLLGVVRARDLVDTEDGKSGAEGPVPLIDMALDVAQLYWDTTSELFLPRSPSETEYPNE